MEDETKNRILQLLSNAEASDEAQIIQECLAISSNDADFFIDLALSEKYRITTRRLAALLHILMLRYILEEDRVCFPTGIYYIDLRLIHLISHPNHHIRASVLRGAEDIGCYEIVKLLSNDGARDVRREAVAALESWSEHD